MAADINDHFMKVGGEGTVTTLASPGKAIAATGINITSAANYPTDTAVVIGIREIETVAGVVRTVPGTYTSWKGIVSGTVVSGLTLKSGTDQDYVSGASTQVFINVSAATVNEMVTGLLVSHDQDGTLKAGAVDNAAVLASNVVTTAKILDANVTPAKLSDIDWQKTIFATAYQSSTGAAPTITAANFTNGNPIELRLNTSLQNDEVFYKVVLAAGTYTFALLSDQDINRGQVQLRINGTNTGSPYEGYAGTRVSQVYATLASGVVIATSGLVTVSLKAATKNASSSGYVMALNRIDIRRTA